MYVFGLSLSLSPVSVRAQTFALDERILTELIITVTVAFTVAFTAAVVTTIATSSANAAPRSAAAVLDKGALSTVVRDHLLITAAAAAAATVVVVNVYVCQCR